MVEVSILFNVILSIGQLNEKNMADWLIEAYRVQTISSDWLKSSSSSAEPFRLAKRVLSQFISYDRSLLIRQSNRIRNKQSLVIGPRFDCSIFSSIFVLHVSQPP